METKKRILLVASHFYPENFKANDLAFELARRGYDITVLAPIPDYPLGKYFPGYGVFKRRKETVNGVKVIRTFVTERGGKGKSLWLMLNYLTHTLFSTIRAVRLAFSEKFDAIIVHETSPVTIGIPAVVVRKMQKIPSYFWVLDLWPESISAASSIRNKYILGFFGKITSWLYRNSDKILIGSKGFHNAICRMGDFTDKIEFFPNWVDKALTSENRMDKKVDTPDFPEGFNVVFTGNIGDAQDMPSLMEAARMLDGTGINFILVGDGRKRQWVESYIKEHSIKNVYLPGRFPLDAMPFFYEKADLLYLSLKDNPIFSITVPAKLQAYMSSGKPVVAMINGEGAEVIKDADCGWSVPAGNADELAALLKKVKSLPPELLAEKGANARAYCHLNYDFDKCMNHLEEIING